MPGDNSSGISIFWYLSGNTGSGPDFRRRYKMAGTIVHLVIADLLAEEWAGLCIVTPYGNVHFEPDYFIAGNICPDGIMARKGYVRKMKKHTHFRDNIEDCDFHKRENLLTFHRRLDNFMENSFNTFKEDNIRSLYFGYLIHMLADEKFMLEIRPEFMENISVTGLTEQNMEIFKYFSKDVDTIDFRLINEYKGTGRIYNALSGIDPYEIKEMVTKEELTDSRQWILNYFFETEHTGIEEPVYISYNRMKEFINSTVIKMKDIFKCLDK